MTGVPFRIEAAGPFPHPPGRRVLAAGRTRGGSPLIQIRARFGDFVATGTRPGQDPPGLAAIKRAGWSMREAIAARQQRDEAAS